MTITEAKNKLVALANSQVEYCEGENNWNKYAAALDPLGITFGPKQNQPWCGEFILWLFWACFGVDDALAMLCSPNPSGIPLCSDGANYFKNAGRWFDIPEVGDVIFVYYSGGINHTGIVVSVSGGIVTSVEGNSGDAVRRNTYAISSPVIAGYGRPRWDVVAAESDQQPEAPKDPAQEPYSYCSYIYPVKVNLLKRGSYGPQVKHMQQLLQDNGFDCGGTDGVFGDQTYGALRLFQEAAKISVDGEWGGESFAAMWNY